MIQVFFFLYITGQHEPLKCKTSLGKLWVVTSVSMCCCFGLVINPSTVRGSRKLQRFIEVRHPFFLDHQAENYLCTLSVSLTAGLWRKNKQKKKHEQEGL